MNLLTRLAQLIQANADTHFEKSWVETSRAGIELDDFCLEQADELVALLKAERR